MEHPDKEKTPGIMWVKRDKSITPYWIASRAAIKAGWPLKTVNLKESPPGTLVQRCQRLTAEMREYVYGAPKPKLSYNGTIGSLLTLYETHPNSPYKKLSASTLHTFDVYLRKIRTAHGERLICRLTGLDVMNWHEAWSAPIGVNPPRLAGALVAVNILKNALTFGQVCGLPDCKAFREILGQVHFEHPEPRNQAPTAVDVAAAMAAAHRLGRPSAALAYALQFETSARQWDIIGQWVPMADERPSSVFRGRGRKKWIGPTWASIDANMTLSLIPSKTSKTTRARVRVGLTNCPMIMSEIASIPPELRTGPLIVDEHTRLPYTDRQFTEVWRDVRSEAGLSPLLWNRDLRAGALTEGGMAGASADDRAKLAGHSGAKMTRSVYDRDVLVASNRVAAARAKFREKK